MAAFEFPTGTGAWLRRAGLYLDLDSDGDAKLATIRRSDNIPEPSAVIQTSTGKYQVRLKESAAPKSVNEEIGFLLRLMGDPGDLLRVRLRKRKMLKLKAGRSIAKAYTVEEKERMLAEAKKARSPHIFPAIMLALNAGIRDAELKNLTWAQMDLTKGYLTAVGSSPPAMPLPRSLRPSSTCSRASPQSRRVPSST
jgi:integrase